MNNSLITGEMLMKYHELNKKKKEIDSEMDYLKKIFHTYFDNFVGENKKGEIIDQGIKLQRQIRKTEKYNEALTIQILEQLNLNDLIKVVKKPDDDKINAALQLGLLTENDLSDCKNTTYSKVISVREV